MERKGSRLTYSEPISKYNTTRIFTSARAQLRVSRPLIIDSRGRNVWPAVLRWKNWNPLKLQSSRGLSVLLFACYLNEAREEIDRSKLPLWHYFSSCTTRVVMSIFYCRIEILTLVLDVSLFSNWRWKTVIVRGMMSML